MFKIKDEKSEMLTAWQKLNLTKAAVVIYPGRRSNLSCAAEIYIFPQKSGRLPPLKHIHMNETAREKTCSAAHHSFAHENVDSSFFTFGLQVGARNAIWKIHAILD